MSIVNGARVVDIVVVDALVVVEEVEEVVSVVARYDNRVDR